MSGASKARVTGCRHFMLDDLRISVLRAEGTVQLVWARKTGHGEYKTLLNTFAESYTASELRAMADHLDTIFGGAS